MSHADPVIHAMRHTEAIGSYSDAMQADEIRLQGEFVTAMLKKQANETVNFYDTLDRTTNRFDRLRPATVAEMFTHTLEGVPKANLIACRALQVCARKGDADAIQALADLGMIFGEFNATVGDMG